MKCRFCDNNLEHVLVDLHNSPPSNSYLSKEALNHPETYYPLKIFVCNKCWLVQVDEHKKANEIFSAEYAYFSSFSSSWLKHSKEYCEMMIHKYHFNTSSFVVEIASNDGYLLQYFKEKNIPVLGVEPTLNTANEARKKGIESINDFFGEKLAREEFENKNKKADLLIGNNVFAHVPAINDFVKGLKIALKPQGIITLEFPHLINLIKESQFDTIYHEHFSYLSLTTVNLIFNRFGLKITDVEELPTHGGSLRIYATHTENVSTGETNEVARVLLTEKEAGVNTLNYYSGFKNKVEKIKVELLDFLVKCKKEGKKVMGYGAAAKGNTLLNYCGIKSDLIEFCADASTFKQNLYMPGSHIKIISPEEIKTLKPDFILIFPWNIQNEITHQLSFISEWGGKFVVSIPELKVL